eukprot:CAMPEP_0196148886 /NCGR_PEP_ID=MMETSP0910-20130528/28629_1 /TAXON_ID=49265 /ORGANISM="Thalassiosira rotula, Strain GSO102" /LENGTH=360 /DNA_ID=CAMNT_0041411683 /DNA_START=53 /DNA_END=1135 /DNA_ORIENTATION=+
MTNEPYPSFVSFSLDDDNHEIDDRSEMTGSCYSDDLLQHEDDFGINLTADPYYYHTLNGPHHTFPQKHEHLELKLQIARQQEKLDILSSKLSQMEVENEALKSEKAGLVDELILAHQKQPISIHELSSGEANANAGPIKLLIDVNANLMKENARLHAVADITRKSFQTHIKDSRISSDKKKKTIEMLQREVRVLRRASCARKSALSERTAKTSLRSSFTGSVIEDLSVDSSPKKNFLEPGPEEEIKFSTSGDDWVIKREEIEAADYDSIRKRVTRRKSVDCMLNKKTKQTFVDESARNCDKSGGIEVNETHRPRPVDRRHTITGEISGRRSEDKSEGLLVDFGETPKPQSIYKRWSSLNW